MFLLQFELEGKKYLLHDGDCFIGGNTYKEAETSSIMNTAKGLSLGGFEIKQYSLEELSKVIGGTPYKIIDYKVIDFVGGLISFHAVPLI